MTSETLMEGARLLAENTIAGKLMAVAGATISTFQGGASALKDVPFPANIAAMTSTISTGLATVKNILSTNIPGATDTSSGGTGISGISLPSMPDLMGTVSETFTNITGADESFINSLPQAVLVVEDLGSVQNRVNIAESNSNF